MDTGEENPRGRHGIGRRAAVIQHDIVAECDLYLHKLAALSFSLAAHLWAMAATAMHCCMSTVLRERVVLCGGRFADEAQRMVSQV